MLMFKTPKTKKKKKKKKSGRERGEGERQRTGEKKRQTDVVRIGDARGCMLGGKKKKEAGKKG